MNLSVVGLDRDRGAVVVVDVAGPRGRGASPTGKELHIPPAAGSLDGGG
jgi:hypothetical protein